MPTVRQRHPNETFEAMFGRFKRQVEKAGVMEDIYRHEFYEKPSEKRVRRKAAAKKRAQREEKQRRQVLRQF